MKRNFKSEKKKSLSVEEVKDYYENRFEALCMNHVDFSYEEDNEVLRNYYVMDYPMYGC